MLEGQTRQGGCGCGSCRYEVTGSPLSIHACHCTDCQTLSGSAFGLSMVLNETDIDLTRGELIYSEFAMSRNVMHRHQCGACGVALWFSSPGYPGIVALKPGTLDDTSDLRPLAHMWVRSAQPWLALADGTPQFQEQPTFEELMEVLQSNQG